MAERKGCRVNLLILGGVALVGGIIYASSSIGMFTDTKDSSSGDSKPGIPTSGADTFTGSNEAQRKKMQELEGTGLSCKFLELYNGSLMDAVRAAANPKVVEESPYTLIGRDGRETTHNGSPAFYDRSGKAVCVDPNNPPIKDPVINPGVESRQPQQQQPAGWQYYYTVQQGDTTGDTIGKFVQACKTNARLILDENNLGDASELKVGQRLKLPCNPQK